MKRSHIFVFDLETTGLGQKGERVVPVQLAGIVLDPDNLKELAEFSTFLKIPEGAVIEPYAMSMHAKKGRDYDFFQREGKDPEGAYRALADFLKPYGRIVMAGHNAAKFDTPMLVRELLLHNVGVDIPNPEKPATMGYPVWIDMDYHVYDTMVLAYDQLKFGLKKVYSVSLGNLCKYLGIPLSETDAHDAMNDVRATAEVLRKLQSINLFKKIDRLEGQVETLRLDREWYQKYTRLADPTGVTGLPIQGIVDERNELKNQVEAMFELMQSIQGHLIPTLSSQIESGTCKRCDAPILRKDLIYCPECAYVLTNQWLLQREQILKAGA